MHNGAFDEARLVESANRVPDRDTPIVILSPS